MTFIIKDIVFQSDRYFLLFNGQIDDVESISKNVWKIYVDGEKRYDDLYFTISEILQIPEMTVLESKQNLNELERVFRKTKEVKICLNDDNG